MDLCGFFVHQWQIRLKDLFTVLYVSKFRIGESNCQIADKQKLIHVGDTLGGMTILCLKAAILIEWIQIFVPRGTRNAFFWSSVAVLALNTLYYFGVRIAENFSCIPYERIWNKTVPGACYDWRKVNLTTSIFNLLSDIMILLLPQGIIWRLHMSLKRKIGISFLFMIGLLYVVGYYFPGTLKHLG